MDLKHIFKSNKTKAYAEYKIQYYISYYGQLYTHLYLNCSNQWVFYFTHMIYIFVVHIANYEFSN